MKQAIDYENHEMTHRFSGNGFIWVQDLPNGYCRVASIGAGGDKSKTQIFTAWKALLATWLLPKSNKEPHVMVPVPIREDERPLVDEIRESLASGRLKVVATRLVGI